MSMTTVVCVIGAGFHGLIAARRFFELYPNTELTIFESDSCLGGVWNRERVYDELLTESSLGMYEYSDEPMICEQITGKEISRYLENYARKYHLYQKIRFNTRVKNFFKSEKNNRWQLELESKEDVIECDKLIIATGLTSAPSIPVLPTEDSFSIPQYHVRSLSKIKVLSSDQHVIVVGGAKSAYDAAYTMVKQGVQRVTLVIKEQNPGAAWLIPQCLLSNISTDKLLGTRLVAAFNPNIWFSNTWLHFLLHQNTIGQWIVKTLWQLSEELIKWQIGYAKNDNMKKLLPQSGSLFWSSTNTCILNHQDFAEMIEKGRIEVKRSMIVELVGPKTVRFADQSKLEADLLIWATGWKSNFFPLPSKKTELKQLAEDYVLNQCPVLRQELTSTTSSSLSLYRRLVPIDYIKDHSIVYVGMLQTPGTGVVAEVQALWSAIYLMNEFEINDNAEWEVAVTNAWLSKRYSIVKRQSHYTHDFIQYADLLLADLGLETTRKKRSWLSEVFEPYMARDYKGLVTEWRLAQEKKKTVEQK